MTFLFWFFLPTMAVDQDKVRETKENEGWKEKTGRGRYREMMKKAGEVGTRVKSSWRKEHIACIPFDGLFPVTRGLKGFFIKRIRNGFRRFEPAISANFSPASTHCFSSLANYLEDFASLRRHRCTRDFKGTIIWGNCSLGCILVYLDTGDALSSRWRERESTE